MTFLVGTRRSPLAQAQTDRVLARLPEGAARKVLVESAGDRDLTTPLHRMERPGAFTSVLTDAILDGRIDAAVHSLKDLPLQAPDEAPVVAVLPRDDPADALLAREEALDPARPLGLRAGARVGTSAPRRQTQALAADPEAVPVDVRGNVGTRLRLLEAGALDALLMAQAAIDRLGLALPQGVVRTRLDPDAFPTGPGQGAIAVQARRGSDAARVLAALDDAPTRRAVEAERALLARLGGGCGLALGATARVGAEGVTLAATWADPGWERDPRPRLGRARVEAPHDEAAVERALAALRAPAPTPAPAPAPARTLLLTLSAQACRAYEEPLARRGWRVVPWELLEAEPTGALPPADAARARWVAVASPRAAPFAARWLEGREGARVAALGPATARALRAEGAPVHAVSAEGTGASLADALARFPGAQGPVLLPRSDDALPDLEEGLAKAGLDPLPWPVYRVRPRKPAPPPAPADALVLASPSNVEALVASRHDLPPTLRLVAFGPATETAMRRAGLAVHGVAARRSPLGLLEALP